MKLDETVIDKILNDIGIVRDPSWVTYIRQNLYSLDLIIKPGDSSQGTLVENK